MIVALAMLTASPMPVQAQSDQPPPADAPQSARRDFSFRPRRGFLGVRGAWLVAREGSDLFAFVQEQLTIGEGDFSTPALAFELGFAVTSRLDVVGGLELSRVDQSSEYRDYVDNDFLPIEQETKLGQTLLTGSLRYALTPRGRRISRYAWVPATFTPYLGAGGGVLWYNFEQGGDFVDYEDLSVFFSRFQASGATPTWHVLGGLDVKAYRWLFLTMEARYAWASGDLSEDFVDFDPIDLSGFRLSGGISLVF